MPVTKRRRLVNLVLVLTILLMACSAALFWMPAKVVKADAGDNYPWKDAMLVPGTPGSINALALWGYTTCPTSDSGCMAGKIVGSDGKTYGYADPWGYALHYCTSWVAWALHDRNSFEMPHAIGDASAWKQWAQNNHYTVDQNPAV